MINFFVAAFDVFEKKHIEKSFTLLGAHDRYFLFDKPNISADDYKILNHCDFFIGFLTKQENLVRELYDSALILDKYTFLFASDRQYDKNSEKYVVYNYEDPDTLDSALLNLLIQYV